MVGGGCEGVDKDGSGSAVTDDGIQSGGSESAILQ